MKNTIVRATLLSAKGKTESAQIDKTLTNAFVISKDVHFLHLQGSFVMVIYCRRRLPR